MENETHKDPANNDPMVFGGEHGFVGRVVFKYEIIFDDENQQREFYRFVKGLKALYKEERTIGCRIAKYLKENVTQTEKWEGLMAKTPSAGRIKTVDKTPVISPEKEEKLPKKKKGVSGGESASCQD